MIEEVVQVFRIERFTGDQFMRFIVYCCYLEYRVDFNFYLMHLMVSNLFHLLVFYLRYNKISYKVVIRDRRFFLSLLLKISNLFFLRLGRISIESNFVDISERTFIISLLALVCCFNLFTILLRENLFVC